MEHGIIAVVPRPNDVFYHAGLQGLRGSNLFFQEYGYEFLNMHADCELAPGLMIRGTKPFSLVQARPYAKNAHRISQRLPLTEAVDRIFSRHNKFTSESYSSKLGVAQVTASLESRGEIIGLYSDEETCTQAFKNFVASFTAARIPAEVLAETNRVA